MLPLALTLATLLLASLPVKDRCLTIATGVLLGNWIANTALAWAGGNPFNWIGMAAVDMTSAVILLTFCRSRWAVLIAATYGAQLIGHVGFSVSEQGPWARWNYWHFLWWGAWAQALLAGLWVTHGGIRMGGRRRDPGRGALDLHALPDPVVQRRDGR